MIFDKFHVIGVTGNSGAGKSVACAILRGLGGIVADADTIGHEIIMRGEPAYNEVLSAFGDAILDGGGEIDRKKLGAIVFADSAKLDKLSKITHKHIAKKIAKIVESARRDFASMRQFAIIDAPLLHSAKLDKMCDFLLVIAAGKQLRIERIAKRVGISEIEAEMRVKAQKNIVDCMDGSETIIYNNGTKSELEDSVNKWVECLKKREE